MGGTLPIIPQSFVAVVLVTVVSLIIAAVSVMNRGVSNSTEVGDTILFPGLAEQADEVTRLIVRSATGTLTIEQGKEGWSLKERDGYPVDTAKVREAIAGMARAVLLEPKTAKAERYILLDLADPAAAGALTTESSNNGRELSLENANGKVLAALIVGKRRSDLNSSDAIGEGEVYVRRSGEMQTWLARTSLFPATIPHGWVNPVVVRIDSTRVAQVIFRHPDGLVVTVTQINPDTSPTVHPIPLHARVNEGAVHRVLTLLSAVTLEDVRRNDEISTLSEKTIRVDVAMRDGLQINFTVYDDGDGATWLAVAADAIVDNPEMSVEAEVVNSRTRGWLYRIPSYTAAIFHTRRDDLITKLEEAAP